MPRNDLKFPRFFSKNTVIGFTWIFSSFDQNWAAIAARRCKKKRNAYKNNRFLLNEPVYKHTSSHQPGISLEKKNIVETSSLEYRHNDMGLYWSLMVLDSSSSGVHTHVQIGTISVGRNYSNPFLFSFILLWDRDYGLADTIFRVVVLQKEARLYLFLGLRLLVD